MALNGIQKSIFFRNQFSKVYFIVSKKEKRCNSTALESQRGVDSQDEYYYEVDSVDDKAQWYAELCPLTAGDSQLAGRDDVGDIAGDEHAAGDEQTVESSVDLCLAHRRVDLSCGQGSVIQDSGDHIDPEQDVIRDLGEVLEDDDLHSSSEQEECRHEDVNFDRPHDDFPYAAGLLAHGHDLGLGSLLTYKEHGKDSTADDAQDDQYAQLIHEEPEASIANAHHAAWKKDWSLLKLRYGDSGQRLTQGC